MLYLRYELPRQDEFSHGLVGVELEPIWHFDFHVVSNLTDVLQAHLLQLVLARCSRIRRQHSLLGVLEQISNYKVMVPYCHVYRVAEMLAAIELMVNLEATRGSRIRQRLFQYKLHMRFFGLSLQLEHLVLRFLSFSLLFDLLVLLHNFATLLEGNGFLFF